MGSDCRRKRRGKTRIALVVVADGLQPGNPSVAFLGVLCALCGRFLCSSKTKPSPQRTPSTSLRAGFAHWGKPQRKSCSEILFVYVLNDNVNKLAAFDLLDPMRHPRRDAHEIAFAQLVVGPAGDSCSLNLAGTDFLAINDGPARRQHAATINDVPHIGFGGMGLGLAGLGAAQKNACVLRRALDQVYL